MYIGGNMFKLQSILIVLLFITSFFTLNCNDNSNPASVDPSHSQKDTSIFIGTWTDVFDTSDNPPGDKQSKLMFWCMGGHCTSPDTSSFLNDSMVVSLSSGFEYYYSYSKDSLYYYSKEIGSNRLVLENSGKYKLSNDTLYGEPDTIRIAGDTYIYFPVSIRISKTPLKK
jgi:hypothetical protein